MTPNTRHLGQTLPIPQLREPNTADVRTVLSPPAVARAEPIRGMCTPRRSTLLQRWKVGPAAANLAWDERGGK
jgi:hypothetical protein